jgi:hypothetical protein
MNELRISLFSPDEIEYSTNHDKYTYINGTTHIPRNSSLKTCNDTPTPETQIAVVK